MFSKNRKPAAAARTGPRGASLSLIGPEVVVTGHLDSAGQFHVEGRIEGDVRCAGLCQSESGVIAGDIQAQDARIGGLVEGNVTAATVTIEATGRVTGDVAYDTISIAAGARVDGRLARRIAVAAADDALPALIATPAEAGEESAGRTLFSGRATRIAD
jgi:cytoskeletal protein CcmA (bactofilin family)